MCIRDSHGGGSDTSSNIAHTVIAESSRGGGGGAQQSPPIPASLLDDTSLTRSAIQVNRQSIYRAQPREDITKIMADFADVRAYSKSPKNALVEMGFPQSHALEMAWVSPDEIEVVGLLCSVARLSSRYNANRDLELAKIVAGVQEHDPQAAAMMMAPGPAALQRQYGVRHNGVYDSFHSSVVTLLLKHFSRTLENPFGPEFNTMYRKVLSSHRTVIAEKFYASTQKPSPSPSKPSAPTASSSPPRSTPPIAINAGQNNNNTDVDDFVDGEGLVRGDTNEELQADIGATQGAVKLTQFLGLCKRRENLPLRFRGSSRGHQNQHGNRGSVAPGGGGSSSSPAAAYRSWAYDRQYNAPPSHSSTTSAATNNLLSSTSPALGPSMEDHAALSPGLNPRGDHNNTATSAPSYPHYQPAPSTLSALEDGFERRLYSKYEAAVTGCLLYTSPSPRDS
eukprot:TRINITY_DN14720_c0_g3_i1.p1 TRINITY_DN14720_c0_g3~~TRINITY_DN14720_c0_g3_i1.p1  ORF type:complete len:451 (-),score=74.12 TRINITY_DN14720_c0_g3_i1:48-1400(-)